MHPFILSILVSLFLGLGDLHAQEAGEFVGEEELSEVCDPAEQSMPGKGGPSEEIPEELVPPAPGSSPDTCPAGQNKVVPPSIQNTLDTPSSSLEERHYKAPSETIDVFPKSAQDMAIGGHHPQLTPALTSPPLQKPPHPKEKDPTKKEPEPEKTKIQEAVHTTAPRPRSLVLLTPPAAGS